MSRVLGCPTIGVWVEADGIRHSMESFKEQYCDNCSDQDVCEYDPGYLVVFVCPEHDQGYINEEHLGCCPHECHNCMTCKEENCEWCSEGCEPRVVEVNV